MLLHPLIGFPANSILFDRPPLIVFMAVSTFAPLFGKRNFVIWLFTFPVFFLPGLPYLKNHCKSMFCFDDNDRMMMMRMINYFAMRTGVGHHRELGNKKELNSLGLPGGM